MNTRIDPRDIKALAIDLDGTILMPNSILSSRMKATLHACIARGLEIIICTGRPPRSAEPYREAIGASGPMVYYNGAEIAEMPGLRVLHSTLLGIPVVRECIDIADEKNIYFQFFMPRTEDVPEEQLLTWKARPEIGQYTMRTGLVAEIENVKKIISSPSARGCIKGMFIGDEDKLELLKAELQEKFTGRAYLVKTHSTFLEIMAPGVSKGLGLSKVLSYRGIKPEETIAFGDEENDIPMFGAAGYAVAPSNAKPAVMDAADLVIGSHIDDAVAEFLDTFFTLDKKRA